MIYFLKSNTMLEKLINISSAIIQLVYTQPNLPSEQYLIQQNQPAVSAQASEKDSIIKLLEKAESQTSKNPKYAAELYINIINSGNPMREKAIESALSAYEKLLAKSAKSNSKPIIESALRVLNHVVEGYENRKEDSNHIDRVYLISGIITCCRVENKDVAEGIRRLEKAKDITNNIRTKIHALNTLGYIEWEHALGGYKGFSQKKAKEYFQEADKLKIQKNQIIFK